MPHNEVNSPKSVETKNVSLLGGCPHRADIVAVLAVYRVPIPDLAAGLWGKRFGARGFISQELFEQLPLPVR